MRTIRITETQLAYIVRKIVLFTLAKMGINRLGYSIVRHMKKSTDDTEIWKDYWAQYHPSHHFPSQPHECPSCLKTKNDFVGGHVLCKDKIYIIPVCRECNSKYKGDKADRHFFYVNTTDMVHVHED